MTKTIKVDYTVLVSTKLYMKGQTNTMSDLPEAISKNDLYLAF